VFNPLQLYPLQDLSFTGVVEQMPSLPGTLQLSHGAAHDVSQHVLSMHCPDAQSVLNVQDCPLSFLQAPAPSQELVPVQAGLLFASSVYLAMFVTHVPVAQLLHGVVQPSLQQWPSTQ
jgi:hypothetical protein